MRRWWSWSAVRWAEEGVVLEDCGDWAARGSDMVSAKRRGSERGKRSFGMSDSF
jgi:hypothetical protein